MHKKALKSLLEVIFTGSNAEVKVLLGSFEKLEKNKMEEMIEIIRQGFKEGILTSPIV
jgi:hypothetical protein